MKKGIFSKIDLFTLIIFLGSAVIFAAPNQKPINQKSPNRIELWQIMRNADANIQKLYLPGTVVEKILSSPNTAGGSQNAGIAIIQCNGGERVLKFYSPDKDLSKMKFSLLIQWYLGKFGICPKVDGIFTNTEILFLQEKGLLPGNLKASFAVIMEKISNPWNFNRGKEAPPEAKDWNHSANVDFMYSLIPLTERLGIIANDPQFLVSKEGRVYYFDLDMVWFVTPKLEVLGNVDPEDIKRFLEYSPQGLKKIKNDSFEMIIPVYTHSVKKFIKIDKD